MAFVFPVLLLVVRHVGAAGTSVAQRGDLVAGGLCFGIVATAYSTHASGLVQARDRGTLKRLRGTPLPPWCYFAGRIAATTGLALAGAVGTLAAAAVLGGGPHIGVVN